MKISESSIQLSSFHTSEEADYSHRETTREGRAGSSPASPRPWHRGQGGTPEVWVDRVSISNSTGREVQSEYSARLSSRSTVSSGTGDTTAEFESQALAEQMVGAVIDRKVTLRTLRDGDDIRWGNDVDAVYRGRTAQGNGRRETLMSMNRVQVHYEAEQMAFASQGQVVTQDGRKIDFSMDLNLDRAFLSRTEEKTIMHTWQEKVSLVDPLVISLDGQVPELTDTRFEFDLDSDGTTEEISFVAKGSGFLSFDKNGDGKINNGSELFGPGTGNGFEELAAHDLDGNHWIDENDAVFSQLSVWTRDDDGNDVLISLKDAGVGAVYLGSAETEFSMTGAQDNELKGQVRRSGLFLFENGNVGSVGQIDLAARAPEPAQAPEPVFQEGGGEMIMPAAGALTAGGTNGVIEDDVSDNPFQALLDQIEKLKEELRMVFDQDRETDARSYGRRLSRGKGWGAVPEIELYGERASFGFRRLGYRFNNSL